MYATCRMGIRIVFLYNYTSFCVLRRMVYWAMSPFCIV